MVSVDVKHHVYLSNRTELKLTTSPESGGCGGGGGWVGGGGLVWGREGRWVMERRLAEESFVAFLCKMYKEYKGRGQNPYQYVHFITITENDVTI